MLKIVRGNLVAQESDAIINPMNADIVFDKGIPFFVKKNGGGEIEKEALRHFPAKLGDVFVTGAGDLVSKKVIHLINRQFGKRTSYVVLVSSLKNALILALEQKLKSIAIPPIYNRFSPEVTANILCDGIKQALLERDEVKDLLMTIVIFDKDVSTLFETVFQKEIPELM